MHKINVDCPHGDDEYLFLDAEELEAAWQQLGLRGEERYRKLAKNFAEWLGEMSPQECLQRSRKGDKRLVARSEAILAQLEDQIVRTKRWRNVDDIVGAVPNVANFLAGVPQCMRRRARTENERGPVSIFMDMTVSSGVSAEKMLARGITVLAFARLLVEHRAVELWAGVALGEGAWSSTVAWKIETKPIDLARAAHLISAPAMTRLIGYGLAISDRPSWNGNWPFGDHAAHCRSQRGRLVQAMGNEEILLIPPMHLSDELVNAPVQWIRREISKLTEGEVSNAGE